jgi:hypothetical protein
VRPLAVAALAGSLALAGCGATSPPPASIEIQAGMPQPDTEDDNALGLRLWSLDPRIVIRFSRGCDAAEYRSTASVWINGVPAVSGGGDRAEAVHLGRMTAGHAVTERTQVAAYPGEAIHLRARVACGTRTADATRTFQLPAASCDDGMLRVYELHGRAEWTDNRGNGGTNLLRTGDLIQSEDGLSIAAGGRAVIGAAECNDFRLDLGPGEYTIGGYRSGARGEGFTGARGRVTADGHAGSWDTGALEVLPLGARCRSCTTVTPATFEVRAERVRVTDGAVLARAGGRTARVTAGEEAGAVCARRHCRLVGPRIFQPAEPWSAPLAEGALPFRAVRPVPAGATPPARELAPAFSHVSVQQLPAAGGAPEQLAVHWSREFRERRGGATEPQEGLLVWQRAGARQWRVVFHHRADEYTFLNITVGDTTGDGHPDVLLVETQGSGACGPRVVVGWAAGRERTLVARNECESGFRLARGALVVDEPVGPCPYTPGSAHCSGGTRHVVMRWRGARLVERRGSVTCALARLDPTRGCVARHR